MTLAVPNEIFKHGLLGLGFFALVPLYLAVIELPGPRSAGLVVGIFGSLQHALTSFWLWFFQDYRVWTLGSTTLAYFLVYAVLGFYLWLFLDRSERGRPLAFVILWCCFEYQKSTGFLGYPWGLLPYSMTDALPMLQVADLAGVYGLTAVLAACNAAFAELLLGIGRPRKAALSRQARLAYCALAIALSVGTLAYGIARMAKPVPQIGSLDAVLVQQDTDPWAAGDDENAVSTCIRLARSAMGNAPRKPDIIVFSETSLLRPYAESRAYYTEKPSLDPLIPFIRESGTWLLTGAPVVINWKTYDATNSAILIDPQTNLVESYAKIHLVPFAESIPFMEYPWFRNFIQKVVGLEGGWATGTRYVIFDLPTRGGPIRFGAPICFEDAYADLCREFSLRGADLLINLTDMSWSKTESAEIQQWASARFRAIEARKTLVRSTNGGVSCVVGPYGQMIDSMPLFVPAAKFVQVPIFESPSPTLYIRFGDWFALAAVLLSASLSIILIVLEVSERRASRTKEVVA